MTDRANFSGTDMRIPTIRQRIIDHLSKLLGADYKIKNRQGENVFVKNLPYGYSKIQFFYDNYFPIDYNAYASVSFYHKTIDRIMDSFYLSIGKHNPGGANIYFSEGDFKPELRSGKVAYRSGYKHKIKTETDLEKMLIDLTSLINDHFLVLENKFHSLEDISKYLFGIRDLLASNYKFSGIATSLICSKLASSDIFEALRSFYIEFNREKSVIVYDEYYATFEAFLRFIDELKPNE